MSDSRHGKILEIIQAEDVYTQQELLQRLHQAGFVVTQATVSRDIKKLGLVKRQTNTGKSKYLCPEVPSAKRGGEALPFRAMMRQVIVDVDYAMNMAVIKCHEGFANAACAAFDSMSFGGVVGTISGDNTFLVLMRSTEDAKALVDQIKQFSD